MMSETGTHPIFNGERRMLESQHIVTETVKAAPPITVSVLTVFGVQLSDIAYLVTILYTSFLLAVLIRDKIWAVHFNKKRRKTDKTVKKESE